MSDPDGDTVKCRWAVRHETNDNAVHGSNLSSLSLDTETCTVTYDGSLDNICTGSNSQVKDLLHNLCWNFQPESPNLEKYS